MALPIGENLALMSESATREQSMSARRATFPNLLGSPLAELRDFISSGSRSSSLSGGTGDVRRWDLHSLATQLEPSS